MVNQLNRVESRNNMEIDLFVFLGNLETLITKTRRISRDSRKA